MEPGVRLDEGDLRANPRDQEQPSSEEKVGFIPGVTTAATEATVIGTATAGRNAGPAGGKLPNSSRPLMASTKIRSPINPTPGKRREGRRLRSLR